jgi:SAM-dependent methyltransferase
MHTEQVNYCRLIKKLFPDYFKTGKVLDVGSLDVNGNNRYLFEHQNYLGIDIAPGKNVDIVCHAADFTSSEKFDTIISTEAFEHDSRWKDSLKHICTALLKPGGLFVFTCATYPRPEHGTKRTDTESSPFTTNYYMNLDITDIERTGILKLFKEYGFWINRAHGDLYFFGIMHL